MFALRLMFANILGYEKPASNFTKLVPIGLRPSSIDADISEVADVWVVLGPSGQSGIRRHSRIVQKFSECLLNIRHASRIHQK